LNSDVMKHESPLGCSNLFESMNGSPEQHKYLVQK